MAHVIIANATDKANAARAAARKAAGIVDHHHYMAVAAMWDRIKKIV